MSIAATWQHQGDDPPRWGTRRGGAWWYLRQVPAPPGETKRHYRLLSVALDDPNGKVIKARKPEHAQYVADAIIRATEEALRRDRERYDEARVWVVSYKDPDDSTYPGVWGVYRTADYAETEAAACEHAGYSHVLISERGLDFPGTTDWWHL